MQDVYIGLDIGGTKIMAAAANGAGKLLERTRATTPQLLDDGIALLLDMVKKLRRGKRLLAIGAAIGGPLDWENGVVSPLHQPEWRDVPLKRIIEDACGCPFRVEVDTDAAVLGEYHFGSSKPRRLLYITVSTGMGGGLLVDGQIFRGWRGAHPEAGHQAVSYRCKYPERISCECGAPDCLEALVSGNGIQRIYGKPAEQLADEEWEEVGYNFGQGLRNLAVLYAPEKIVISGGVTIGGRERLLGPARQVVKERMKLVPQPEIVISNSGYDAALMGAIALALFS